MKKTIILITSSLLLTACSTSTFYQVYKTAPANGIVQSNKILFEDNNAQITYNLWDNGGDVGFLFYNKSTQDITIHLDKSFFVLNGTAYDYFKYRTFTRSSNLTSMTAYRTYPYSYYNTSVGGTISSSNTTSFIEPNVIIVPPKTSRRVSEYVVTSSFLNSCDMLKYPSRKKIKALTFDKNNSPFTFSNLITYSISGDTNRLENNFYVTSISNMPENEVFETKPEIVCDKQTMNMIKIAKIGGPELFYIQYTTGK
ncbi:hypothetical protein AEM51_00360 [Bacteroidetes bacterium UKL13-3]|jgi:hypothetical protein|nr:hypothetical protein AEM51_00360 [Bacteroidetes bacterium UKL13-3]